MWLRLRAQDVFGGGRRRSPRHLVRRDDHLYEPDALRELVRRWVPLRRPRRDRRPVPRRHHRPASTAALLVEHRRPRPRAHRERLPARRLPAGGAGRQPARRRRRHAARSPSAARSSSARVRTWVLDVSGGSDRPPRRPDDRPRRAAALLRDLPVAPGPRTGAGAAAGRSSCACPSWRAGRLRDARLQPDRAPARRRLRRGAAVVEAALAAARRRPPASARRELVSAPRRAAPGSG